MLQVILEASGATWVLPRSSWRWLAKSFIPAPWPLYDFRDTDCVQEIKFLGGSNNPVESGRSVAHCYSAADSPGGFGSLD